MKREKTLSGEVETMAVENPPNLQRRLYPRFWSHDYLLMKRIAEAFEHLVHKHLHNRAALSVLDYGCGDMPYRSLFLPYASEYLGADLPSNNLAVVRLNHDGKLPLQSESIDVLLSSQVLEHVANVDAYLAECSRVLKRDGLLLLSTHGTWVYHPHPMDLRRWTRDGLLHEIGRAGFVTHDVASCIGPLAYTTQLRLLLLKGVLRKLGRIGDALVIPFSIFCQGLMWIEDRITPVSVSEHNASVYVVAARRT